MQRTQIYLTQAEAQTLAAVSRKTGKTRAQLIREAVDERYMKRRGPADAVEILRDTAGCWSRRGRRSGGQAYVERLRRGRLARLHEGAS